MLFSVLDRDKPIPASAVNQFYLLRDNWDDYHFKTLFLAVFVDENKQKNTLGGVKIGHFGFAASDILRIPSSFEKLDEQFFSLGQDESYYSDINKFGDRIRDEILLGLNDIAKDEKLFDRAIEEDVTKISLLRQISLTSVRGQFRRLVNGGARLSPYKFSYISPKSEDKLAPHLVLSFDVEPESNPPTNIHVLIGRNGVGKTYIINNMINSLLDKTALALKVGSFLLEGIPNNKDIFANLVSVTFSAFDSFMPFPERNDKSGEMQYSYIGLKDLKSNDKNISLKNPQILEDEFVKSVKICLNGAKGIRWKRALEMLEADPNFQEVEVASIASFKEDNDAFTSKSSLLFRSLSSGHKIVLLTITRLVEVVEERTLVLLDEPEAHLHPPLLSAFIRVLSDLLIHKNGVAIIATHSPVILQEVPKNCVWKLRRTGSQVNAERLESESFGENVGTLTREVFGLEVTHSGFHKLLIDAVNEGYDYNSIVSHFDNQLGMEARAIIRTLLSLKNKI